MRLLQPWLMLAACWLPGQLAAQTAAPPTLLLDYDGTLAGVRMVQVTGQLNQTATGYSLRVGIITVGAARLLMRGHADILSQGSWNGPDAQPNHVDSEAMWNGRPHRLVMDYVAARPLIRVLQPPQPAERQHGLNTGDAAGSIDSLGLFVGLIHRVGTTSACNLHSRIFDGHGLADFTMTAAPAADTSGQLRCDFSTRKITANPNVTGAQPSEDPRRVGRGYAVFASPQPGLPLLPVRLVFHTGLTGDAVLTLSSARVAPATANPLPFGRSVF